MTSGQHRYIPLLLVCLLFLTGSGDMLFSQTHISSNANVYKHVTSVGVDFVVVDNTIDFNKFNPGDTVLLIQMKGVEARVDESAAYGDPTQLKGSPGKYEFLIVLAANSLTKTIQFKNNLTNTFDTSGDVQLIRIPSYYSVIVDATGISCPAWDSTLKTGGVLSIIVGKTLTLNGDIDASGKGYKGGAPIAGDGICTGLSSNNYSYDNTYTNSGWKGDGMVSWGGFDMLPGNYLPIFPYYSKGKGANLIGGGGGSGKYSGGGGGANIANGGRGGLEGLTCSGPNTGGSGGKGIKGTILEGGRIFMGGGAGGSTAVSASAGGNGGGIIIILCNEIIGNGHSIRADGADALPASGTSGAGGGGGGGSIAIYLESYNTGSVLNLSVKGGNGGNTTTGYGEGGGGGGGLIWSSIGFTANVARSAAKGLRGLNGGIQNASDGYAGDILATYVPVLNGFLFNTIRSSGTGNLTDSICSNNIPYQVLGTIPVGGSGSYTYLWQKRKYRVVPWTSIPASNVQNFTFTSAEADSFEIRRIVTDNVTTLTDTSKQALVMVQPMIQNNNVRIYSNIISLTDTICFNGDPKLIDQVLPDIFVPTTKNLFYFWQDSSQTSTWGATLNTTKSYDPNPTGGLQKDTWYRRKVVSGRCADSTAKVKFTVLPLIQNNTVSAAQEICHGMTFADLTQASGFILSGGDNTYRFNWQGSTTGAAGTWTNATGIINTSGYNPPESPTDTEVRNYYRRMVYSGNHDVCKDSSASLLLIEWKKISNNFIASGDQTICSGSVPAGITGTVPADGNHVYTILWLQKTALTPYGTASGPNPTYQDNYQPPALTDTTWYRRYVTSSVCTDTSAAIVVKVHKPITNNSVALRSAARDTTICVDQPVPLIRGADPSGGTNNPADDIYLWQVSTPGNNSWITAGGTSNAISYQTGSLANITASPLMYYYRRSFTSGMCSTYSDTVSVKVLARITNNVISADQAVCYNTVPAALTGPGLTGGDPALLTWKWMESTDGGTTWSTTASASDQQNYAPPALTAPMSYRRWIYSGLSNCCVDSSNILSISINPLPISVIAPATDTICEGTSKPFSLAITGSTSAPWNITYRETNRRNNTSTSTSVSESSASSTILVTPVIPGATTDSASFSYSVSVVTDSKGCNATSMTGSRNLVVYKVPVPNAYADTSVCGPVATIRGATNVSAGKWLYSAVPSVDSIISGNILTISVDSTLAGLSWPYTFTWKVLNWQCEARDQKVVTFFKRAAKADAGPDTTIFSLTKDFQLRLLTPTVGKGTWYSVASGDSVPGGFAQNLLPGANYFEWKVVNGICMTSDQMIVTVNDLIVPDAFSPNGDGHNDVFEILGLDTIKSEITLTIVNSAGAQVYYSSNINGTYAPWNGENSKGQLPDGTYYYVVTIKSTNPPSLYKKGGFVVLKRDIK